VILRSAALTGLILVALLAPSPSAQAPDAMAMLDRYAHGDFDAVAAALDTTKDFTLVLKQLKSGASSWIAAGGADDRDRRELAAATFALEAARAGELDDWKLVQSWMGLENIYWHGPPQLIEWGCALLRAHATPKPIERVWHLAALAVADRAIDYEFLIGSPWEGRANRKDEILHLEHSIARFPYERRFALAQGIAAEWRLFPGRRSGAREAQLIFEKLRDDDQVSGEANVRLGVMQFRSSNTAAALRSFAEAEQRSREPYVIYLARFFRGQALDRQRKPADAEREYRGALTAVPRAQSASFALAALLSGRGHRAEAATLVNAAVTAEPRPLDPWRAYGEADARFWPELIAELRAEIRR
jgi:tetratricopeptide (TPR) repeat protein